MAKGDKDGAILQRDKETYAIVPRTPVGLITPEILENMAKVVREFQIPVVKITSGQRIALVGLKEEQLEDAWKALQIEAGQAIELCLHYVQACPGNDFCRYGMQNSIGLGTRLEEKFRKKDLPAKLKIGVSGCPFCCAESYVRDIGFFGKKNGWTMILGGNAGGHPRIGDVIAQEISDDEAEALCERFLAYYRENARNKERTAKFVQRVGIEAVTAAIL